MFQGWEDYHYHVFKVHNLNTKPKRIDHVGRPIEKLPKGPVDGNSVKMTTYFKKPGDAAEYWYDFGDRWEHKVVLQKIFPAEANKSYPRCVDGRRACPPEDCGGTEGYENFLRVLGNKKDPEHASTKNWLKNNRKHADFSPDKFDATSVIFRPKEARQYPYQNTAEANFYVYITMM